MARRGDGIHQRGRTWWLDFVHRGDRHVVRIGSNINRTVAKEKDGARVRVNRGCDAEGTLQSLPRARPLRRRESR